MKPDDSQRKNSIVNTLNTWHCVFLFEKLCDQHMPNKNKETRKEKNIQLHSSKTDQSWKFKTNFQVANAKKTNEQQFEFMLNSPLWVEGELRR